MPLKEPLVPEHDATDAVRHLDLDSRMAIGYAAAQFSCVVESNFPMLEKDLIEDLAIDFAYRLFLTSHRH